MTLHQATCVAIAGRGLLIEGPPGSGKSSLALALLDRGAELVGDDGIALSVDAAGQLVAASVPATAGMLEVRNVGIVPVACRAEVGVALVIRLDPDAPRYIEAADRVMMAGCDLPMVRLWPDSPVLALRAEVALRIYGLTAAANREASG